MRNRQPLLLVVALLASACTRTVVAGSPSAGSAAPVPAPAPARISATDVLGQMQRRYADSLPRAIAYTQTNVVYTDQGNVRQQWRVLVDPPSRMRVEFLPTTSHSGILYVGDQATTIVNGRTVGTQSRVNGALLLGYGIFGQPLDATRRMLDSLDVALGAARSDTLDGRTVWVIGDASRPGASQLWIDAERLVPVRLVAREERGSATVLSDTRYSGWAKFGGFPLATLVQVYRDGKLVLREELSGVRVNPPVPAGAFDPSRF